ncbi:MAG: hypothetical protein AABX04_05895 [Nanoarchaeota archaeon]
MPKELTLDQTYDKCAAEGNIILQDNLDVNRITSMVQIAKNDLESVKSLLKNKEPRFGVQTVL